MYFSQKYPTFRIATETVVWQIFFFNNICCAKCTSAVHEFILRNVQFAFRDVHANKVHSKVLSNFYFIFFNLSM